MKNPVKNLLILTMHLTNIALILKWAKRRKQERELRRRSIEANYAETRERLQQILIDLPKPDFTNLEAVLEERLAKIRENYVNLPPIAPPK